MLIYVRKRRKIDDFGGAYRCNFCGVSDEQHDIFEIGDDNTPKTFICSACLSDVLYILNPFGKAWETKLDDIKWIYSERRGSPHAT